jgi:hypothetical protein
MHPFLTSEEVQDRNRKICERAKSGPKLTNVEEFGLNHETIRGILWREERRIERNRGLPQSSKVSFPIATHVFVETSRPGHLAIANRSDGRLIPMEVRPDVGAALAAGPAHEARFQIGEPGVIRPRVRADRNRVAAMMV